jgi:HAD superfamily hydrolase (TIGR01509 family)
MPLKALIFDVDGTLADTELNGHRVAYNKTFAELGLDWQWSPELYGDLLSVSGGKERMHYYVSKYSPALPAEPDLDTLISDIYTRKTQVFKEMLVGGALPLREGVKRLFREAMGAGLRLAIATTTAPSNVKYLISSNLGEEALDWFDIIAAGDIVPNMKPSPEIYQLVLDEMGWDAVDCLAFEDSYNGVRSALGAGLPVIITITDYTRDDNFNGADLVLSRLGDPDHPAEVINDSKGGFNEEFLTVNYLRQAYA